MIHSHASARGLTIASLLQGGSPRGRRLFVVLATLAVAAFAMLANASGAMAVEQGDLDQCGNGTLAAPEQCINSAWVNGNLGASKAHYLEGDSVPYRLKLTNLIPGTVYTAEIEWDTTKGGKHALDYITSFDRTETDADPCTGVLAAGLCALAPSTTAIPVDSQATAGQDQIPGNGDDITQVPGVFSLWGGNLTGTSGYTRTGSYAGDSATSINVTFMATGTTAVLAWGGHIASRVDWGPTNSAIAIPGSPYHMRQLTLTPPGGGGNQDRSLSTDAVIFPATFTVIKQATPEGATSFPFTTNFTTATFNGSFNLVDDGTSANTKTISDIVNFVNTPSTVTEGAVPNWTLNSIACTQTAGFTGAVTNFNGDVGTRTAGATINEGDTVVCTFTNSRDQGKIEVVKDLNPGTDTGRFNLQIDGITEKANAGDTDTTGEKTVNTGTHTVGETQGNAGVLSDYQKSIVCLDTANQNQQVAATNGDNAGPLDVPVTAGSDIVCTVTNTRETGKIEVVKDLNPGTDTGPVQPADRRDH